MEFETIMVDDDEVANYLHRMILSDCMPANSLSHFVSGKDCIAYLTQPQDKQKSYLILLDINMPEMNGWEFLEEINKQDFSQSLWVIMLTSSVDVADKKKAENYKRVIDFIEKPLSYKRIEGLKTHEFLLPFFN